MSEWSDDALFALGVAIITACVAAVGLLIGLLLYRWAGGAALLIVAAFLGVWASVFLYVSERPF